MARPEVSITEAEWDVLKSLWALGPTTARAVADHLAADRGWAYSTVKTMLDRMAEKGLVKARQVGNVWEFSAAVAEADARRGAWRRFVDAAFGGAVAPALAFIAAEGRLTRKERERLMDLLREEARDDR
jgi:BlaI family penicillinase repressor